MKPDYAVMSESLKGVFKILTVDTAKATYKGLPWRTLGDFGKRKFENMLVIERSNERLKILYV